MNGEKRITNEDVHMIVGLAQAADLLKNVTNSDAASNKILQTISDLLPATSTTKTESSIQTAGKYASDESCSSDLKAGGCSGTSLGGVGSAEPKDSDIVDLAVFLSAISGQPVVLHGFTLGVKP